MPPARDAEADKGIGQCLLKWLFLKEQGQHLLCILHLFITTTWRLLFRGENAWLAKLDYFPSLVGGGTLLLKEYWGAVTERGGIVVRW